MQRSGLSGYAERPAAWRRAAARCGADGKAEIDLPESAQIGKTSGLRGKGIKGARSRYPGDLYRRISVETLVRITEYQRKLLKELDESFRKSGDRHSPFAIRHSPNAKSCTDRVNEIFK